MTSMSDPNRALIETLSDRLYSTKRKTDFLHRRMKPSIHAPRKTLIAHEIIILSRQRFGNGETIFSERGHGKYFSEKIWS